MSPTHSPKQTWISDEAGIVCEGWGLIASIGLPEAYWERGGGDPTLAEVEAMERHANLIAAAPELYEALQPFADVLADVGEDEDDADLYRAMSPEHRRAPAITVGHLRRALAALSKARPSRGEA